MNTTRANTADKNRAKTVANVSTPSATTPDYEVPTEGPNGVSAKVIDWPDTDRAPTIVEIAGVRFTRSSGQVTIISRTPPEATGVGWSPKIRRQARLDAIGNELEALVPADQRDHASRLLGEFEILWGGRVNDVHDYVLRQVGYALTDPAVGLNKLWLMLFARLGPGDDRARPEAAVEFLHGDGVATERGGHWQAGHGADDYGRAAFGPPQPNQPTDALDVQVLAILQDGRVHHRHALAAEVGANVRQVRAAVSRLRVLGWPIGFGSSGGYRLTWERRALEALLRKYRSQALAELRIHNRLRRMLAMQGVA